MHTQALAGHRDPSDEVDIEMQVVEAQVRALAKKTRYSRIAVPTMCIAYAIILVPTVGWLPVIAWCSAVILLVAWRNQLFGTLTPQRMASRHWKDPLMVRSMLCAVVVSASAPMFFAYLTPTQRGFVSFFLGGWAVIGATMLGNHPWLFRRYITAFAFNVGLAWMIFGDQTERVLMVCSVVCTVLVLFRYSNEMSVFFEETVRVRYEKDSLVAQLEAALAETRAANATRARFFAAASHDLRQPVHALMLLSGLLDRYSTNPRQSELARQIQVTSESIDAMFRGLLDLARIDAGAIQAKPEPLELQPLFENLRAAYASQCEARGAHFLLAVEPGLAILGDTALFPRVIRNLTDNAVKFTRAGQVMLSARREGEFVRIRISDSGPGISPEDLAMVMEPFFRAKNAANAEVDGVGLGLSVAANFAQLMGHELSIESAVGTGTCVTLLCRAAVKAPSAESKGMTQALSFQRIALLEDDRTARVATRLWLEEQGCTVLAAGRVEELLSLIGALASPPDLLIADYDLGGEENGVTAIAAVRHRFGDIPAAIVTGAFGAIPDLPSDVPVVRKPLKSESLRTLLASMEGQPGAVSRAA